MRKDKTKQKGFTPTSVLSKTGVSSAKTERGFTLLIAVLATSIILSISLGVFDITIKEIKLSGLGRESQIAFYAADAGVECAFYWEIKKDAFAFNSDSNNSPKKTITCGDFSDNVGYNKEFSFSVGASSCVKVNVTKENGSDDVIIESRGYNNTDCDSTSSFKVERAIKLTLKKS